MTAPLPTGQKIERNFLTDVGFDSIDGYERWTLRGRNPDVDTGTLPEVIWPGGVNLTLPPFFTTPTVQEIVSDSASDTGLAVVDLLNSNYDRVQVVVTLTGTGALQLSSAVAVNSIYCPGNVGNITVRDTGGGTTRCFAGAGRGISQSAWYTVPRNYTLQINSYLVSINRTIAAGRYATFTAGFQQFSGSAHQGAFFPTDVAISDDTPFFFDLRPGLKLNEKSRVWLTAQTVSADNTDLTAGAWGVLKRNDVL